MKQFSSKFTALLAVSICPGIALAIDGEDGAGLDVSATLRITAESAAANGDSVLAPANALIRAGRDTLRPELEMRAKLGAAAFVGTLRHAIQSEGKPQDESIINELHWGGTLGKWHVTLGKKIVSWDVGYGFRPLDVLQQENRRSLVGSTQEGVPVVLGEYFTTNTAWTLALANPMRRNAPTGNEEPALAVRAYWRQGETDWHAVLRQAQETGARGGLAVSHVASDAIELHASVLRAQRLEHIVNRQANPMQSADYALQAGRGGWQALVGGTWTSESKLSVLAEVWHDDRAWSRRQWRQWHSHALAIPALPIPQAARNGMLADEADALRSPSLHRDNVLLRAAWTGDNWEPSAEWLYMPADDGSSLTLRLAWKGDRSSVEFGQRMNIGPGTALARQLPSRHQTYVSASLSF